MKRKPKHGNITQISILQENPTLHLKSKLRGQILNLRHGKVLVDVQRLVQLETAAAGLHGRVQQQVGEQNELVGFVARTALFRERAAAHKEAVRCEQVERRRGELGLDADDGHAVLAVDKEKRSTRTNHGKDE
jgi:hypothetical protein